MQCESAKDECSKIGWRARQVSRYQHDGQAWVMFFLYAFHSSILQPSQSIKGKTLVDMSSLLLSPLI